jgi:phage replication-related protein YjqB (UPF0714/DUF867 family)
MDAYQNYQELSRHEKENVDYLIRSRAGVTTYAVVAIHGGGIEPGTIDIADAVAGNDHAFYAFKGLKEKGNAVLHISSNRFDEPECLKTAMNATIVISIHGHHSRNKIVYVGGLHTKLKRQIIDCLTRAGFRAEEVDEPGLRARMAENICNRCRCGQGVQLEISIGLRLKMFDHLTHRPSRRKTAVFHEFVSALRKALQSFSDVKNV